MDTTKVEELSNRIGPMLAGLDDAIQSAVIADLLSCWIVGHHPNSRAEVFRLHMSLVQKLIPINEQRMFGPAGHPGWTQRAQ